MIPKLNDNKWYREPVYLCLDRLQILSILGSLELSIRHPDLPLKTHKQFAHLGKTLASMLIDEGIMLPDEILESWEKSFKMKCELKPNDDLNAVYLDNYGALLK